MFSTKTNLLEWKRLAVGEGETHNYYCNQEEREKHTNFRKKNLKRSCELKRRRGPVRIKESNQNKLYENLGKNLFRGKKSKKEKRTKKRDFEN